MRRRRLGATHPVAREPSATRSVSLDKQPAFSTHVAAARVPPAGISRNVAVNDHGGLGRERAFILPISRTGADKESKTWMQRPKLRTWVGFS